MVICNKAWKCGKAEKKCYHGIPHKYVPHKCKSVCVVINNEPDCEPYLICKMREIIGKSSKTSKRV
jgi:hypothetical protein